MTGTAKTRRSLRWWRLTAGFGFWSVILSSAVGAQPPFVIAPVTGFRPVPSVEASRSPLPPKVTPSPTLRAPEPVRALSTVSPAKATPKPPVVSGKHSIRGIASWYCSKTSPCFHGYPPGSAVAAAGPKLRAAICGNQASNCWRNRHVFVNGVEVVLRDWCQCFWHDPREKIIDLYKSIFDLTGSSVRITW